MTGSFALSFTGMDDNGATVTKTTGPITWKADMRSDVETALESVSNIRAGTVDVIKFRQHAPATGECTFVVTFTREQYFDCTRPMDGWNADGSTAVSCDTSSSVTLMLQARFPLPAADQVCALSEGDLAELVVDVSLLSGTNVRASVTEQVKGRAGRRC